MKRASLIFVLNLLGLSVFAQWEADKRITDYPSHFDYGSLNNAWTIAVRDTTVHIVWEHRLGDSGPGELYYRRSVNSGNSFDPDTQLTTEDSHHPSVAVCDSIVHIVRYNMANYEIYYNRSIDNGENWGPDERLTDNFAFALYPSVAVRDSIVHVVWQDERDGNYEIYYNRSIDNGENWGINERLTNDPAGSYCPSVAVCDSIVHIVWQDERDGNLEIYYNRSIDDGETWGIDERLTNDSAGSRNPSVAVCDSIVHVVWRDSCDGNWEIYYNRSSDYGATWDIDNFRLTNDTAPSKYPSIAGCDSIVHVVWSDMRDGNYEIYYNWSIDNGENWEIDDRLTFAAAVEPWSISVACWDCSYDYDVHVTWTDNQDGNLEIYYKRHKCEGSGIEEDKELRVKNLELRVYPNPSFGNAVIKYGLQERASITLRLYDISGRMVKTLYSGVQEKGYYEVDIKQDELKGGIYFIRFETGDYKATRKLTILR